MAELGSFHRAIGNVIKNVAGRRVDNLDDPTVIDRVSVGLPEGSARRTGVPRTVGNPLEGTARWICRRSE